MKHYLLPLAFFTLFFVPKAGIAKQGMWEKFAERRMERFLSKLDLTDDQKQKLKEVREKNKGALRAARQKKREAFQSLAQLMKSESKDEKDIRDAFKNLQAVKSEAENAHFEVILEIRNLLTPEQREKFHYLLKQRISRGLQKLRDEEM